MLNNIILLFIAFLAIVVDYIIVDYRNDKALFAMYKNRDKLYLLALKNKNEEDEIKYKYMQMRITRQISLLKNQIPIVSIIETTSKITVEDKLDADKLIESIKSNPELREIYDESNYVFEKRLNEKTFLVEYLVMKPLAFVLGVVFQIQKHKNLRKKIIKERRKKYYTYKQFSDDLCSVFMQYSTW